MRKGYGALSASNSISADSVVTAFEGYVESDAIDVGGHLIPAPTKKFVFLRNLPLSEGVKEIGHGSDEVEVLTIVSNDRWEEAQILVRMRRLTEEWKWRCPICLSEKFQEAAQLKGHIELKHNVTNFRWYEK